MITPVLFDGRSPEKTIEFISDFLQTSQVFWVGENSGENSF